MGLGIIIGVTFAMLALGGLLGALIYLYVYTFKNIKQQQTAILEIKSKIGSMIRDINLTNKQEYTVDMEQQHSINSLISRLK